MIIELGKVSAETKGTAALNQIEPSHNNRVNFKD